MSHILVWLAMCVAIGLVIGFFVWQFLANMATTVYLHRSFAHKSLQLAVPARMFYRIIIWVTTGIRPGEWVAEHRVHHQNTDEYGDPHSPYFAGIHQVVRHNGRLYREWLDQHPSARAMFKDTGPDKLDLLVFDRSTLGLFIGVALMFIANLTVGVLLGESVVMVAIQAVIITSIASLIHAPFYLLGGGWVNGICHWMGGYKNYANNKAVNKLWVALLTAGEGLHNNHHGDQNSPRLWRKWWELPFDAGWWLGIRPLMFLGLAKLRPVRPVAAQAA